MSDTQETNIDAVQAFNKALPEIRKFNESLALLFKDNDDLPKTLDIIQDSLTTSHKLVKPILQVGQTLPKLQQALKSQDKTDIIYNYLEESKYTGLLIYNILPKMVNAAPVTKIQITLDDLIKATGKQRDELKQMPQNEIKQLLADSGLVQKELKDAPEAKSNLINKIKTAHYQRKLNKHIDKLQKTHDKQQKLLQHLQLKALRGEE